MREAKEIRIIEMEDGGLLVRMKGKADVLPEETTLTVAPRGKEDNVNPFR